MSRKARVGCHQLIRQDPKIRVCLRCDKKFQSLGPLNRLCSYCASDVNRDRSNNRTFAVSFDYRGPSLRKI